MIRLLVSHLPARGNRELPHGNIINLIISTWLAFEGRAVFFLLPLSATRGFVCNINGVSERNGCL